MVEMKDPNLNSSDTAREYTNCHVDESHILQATRRIYHWKKNRFVIRSSEQVEGLELVPGGDHTSDIYALKSLRQRWMNLSHP